MSDNSQFNLQFSHNRIQFNKNLITNIIVNYNRYNKFLLKIISFNI